MEFKLDRHPWYAEISTFGQDDDAMFISIGDEEDSTFSHNSISHSQLDEFINFLQEARGFKGNFILYKPKNP